jgi:hypothetical protein
MEGSDWDNMTDAALDPRSCLSAADVARLMGPDEPDSPPPAPKKPPAIKEYHAARLLAEAHPRPLAALADRVYELTPTGWSNISSQIRAQLNATMARHAPGAYRCILDQICLPQPEDAIEPMIYLQRAASSTNWTPKWSPARIFSHEILFSDVVYDCITGNTRPLPGVIWGPRVDLPVCAEEELLLSPEYLQAQELFQHTLEFALPDEDNRRHFQEVMSTILQPHYHIRHQITLWGVPHSAKTTLANAVAVAPAGLKGASFVQEQHLVRDKWATIMLQCKFANISNDSARTSKWTPFFKAYTSGAMVIESKGFAPYTVIPTAKLLSTCNEMQDLADSSGATHQRLLAFRFDHARPRSKSSATNEIMLPSFWAANHRRQAVVSWLLGGAERFHKRGYFQAPESNERQVKEAMRDADPLIALLSDLLEVDKGAFLPTATILQHLPAHVSPNRLNDYLRHLFPLAVKDRVKVDQLRQHGYRNIRLA